MKAAYEANGVQIFQGDCREVLRQLPDESVHCVVTSPPYWGLRDYGCEGQIGLEDSPVKYIATMREVFREVRRVLRADGTLWLNMGDSFWGSGKGLNGDGTHCSEHKPTDMQFTNKGSLKTKSGDYRGLGEQIGLKPKDLVGIPWMLAFALREDGWYLRQDIIWSKPNPMPESVTDRCTKAHEYIFLLSKSERYYYNAEAIAEPFADERNGNPGIYRRTAAAAKGANNNRQDMGFLQNGLGWNTDGGANGRNKRDVWVVNSQPFPEAHFATFPEDLIKPCILAGCPEGGTVLDPFLGSGTTALVARKLHSKAIGIELNAEYITIAERRLRQEVLEFAGGVANA